MGQESIIHVSSKFSGNAEPRELYFVALEIKPRASCRKTSPLLLGYILFPWDHALRITNLGTYLIIKQSGFTNNPLRKTRWVVKIPWKEGDACWETHPILQQHPCIINSTDDTCPSTAGAETEDHGSMCACGERELTTAGEFLSRLEEGENETSQVLPCPRTCLSCRSGPQTGIGIFSQESPAPLFITLKEILGSAKCLGE